MKLSVKTLCLSTLCALVMLNSAAFGGEGSEKDNSGLVQLSPFVLNVMNKSNSGFLKLALALELSSPALSERLKTRVAVIRDSTILLLSGKSAEELRTPEGKLQLKDELAMRLNQVLGERTIKDIYITDFVMQ